MFGEGHSSCQVENQRGRSCAGGHREGVADGEGELVTARAGLMGRGTERSLEVLEEFRSQDTCAAWTDEGGLGQG